MPARWFVLAVALVALPSCKASSNEEQKPAPPGPSASVAPSAAQVSEGGVAPASETREEDAGAAKDTAVVDDRPLHHTTQEELLALISIAPGKKFRKRDPGEFLRRYVGPDGPGQTNQGNPALARHVISRASCLEGLRGVTLQTEAQREACGGHENMVPIYEGGDAEKAKACIDVFEYPNRACELPMVWVPPAHAAALCELQGKRLCTQEEWVLSCRGDPGGGEPSTYAYGSELDLDICNTNKPAAKWSDKPCDPRTIDTTWASCATNTEPSGSYPRCRSRFGVFDQHGNVAEAMTRFDPEENKVVSQLKGSAFFYVDVARRLDEPPRREVYSDHCAHDPRWHVQPLRKAFHVNYHLGFRCCYARGGRSPGR
ncbi:SUMF1/EgtB/PvdO family nonheme iron enzyme [Polyangium sp. 6x1]|uniref:SUMF1/EgtB/PvdO family nonheme iron enzyme n=1 Tax=Polyangium sp. 6x1 TaxID=3042689 RepID=UPI002482B0BD|nr:SUMF1/EgtB/PvdO family nonheme iron enzyme [Polyangium sp. 6x1]MDI1451283.1 SUMF1/EgtB/PvdO family nonheme iron enzyme [Polyangium sp. 6x1]